MIKHIVLDMGGVCCMWDPIYLSTKLTSDPTLQKAIRAYVFSSKQWTMLDEGMITTNDALKQMLENAPSEYNEIIEHTLYHWYDYFDQIKGMEELIIEYKQKGFDFYLLSNCSKQFYEYYHSKSIFSHFKSYYISADHKLLKPSTKIYEDFCRENHLISNECLFVDDNIENVEGAKKINMDGYHFTGDLTSFKHYLDQLK